VRSAAEIAYQAIAADAVFPIDEPMAVNAIREDVRRSREFSRAIAALEKLARVTWKPTGEPQLSGLAGQKFSAVALADVLMCAGQRERAERLLALLLADMDYESKTLGRGDSWQSWSKAVALALLGRREAFLAEIERPELLSWRTSNSWYFLDRDPVLKPFVGEPRFAAVRKEIAARLEAERTRYVAMNPPSEPAT
jgi:hypothetical protein